MQSVISFTNVKKTYNKRIAISDITFDIKKGTITTLMGPNGVGKTTIARLMLGIEKPTSGVVNSYVNSISYIPQKIILNNSMPLNVKSFIELMSAKCYLRNANFQQNTSLNQNIKSNRKYISLDLSKFIDFEAFNDRMLHELSGGEIQKILVASSLVNCPELIVLDEPTNNLDLQSQDKLYQMLHFAKINYNSTIFIISHDLHTVMKESDNVICIEKNICCKGVPSWKNTSSHIAIYNHNHHKE